MPANDQRASHRSLAADTCAVLRVFAENLTDHAPLPGGVIVVADRRGLLAQTPFGQADLERRIPMADSHLFEIGSISKVFTSLLVGQLIDDGLLDLDEAITDILPWVDLGRQAEPVTLTRLLNHTAGIVIGDDALPDEAAQIWSLRHRVVGAGGTEHFHYSNVGYMMAGLAVSARTGRALPDLVTERLLEPMGMSHAIASITHQERNRFATGYVPAREDRPWVPGDLLIPAPWFEVAGADGNIAATGADMSRLVMLLLGDGEVEDRRVVAPSVLTRMTSILAPSGEEPVEIQGLPAVEHSRYGLGINVESVGGNVCLSHGGGMVGYSTFILADTTAGVGIVVLTNSNGDNLHAQLLARVGHADLIARMKGEKPQRLPDPDPTVRRPENGSEAQPPVGLGGFIRIGSESSPAELAVTVSSAGQPVLIESDGQTGRLYRMLTGRYVTDHPGLRRFHLDPVLGSPLPRWTHGSDLYISSDESPEAVLELTGLQTTAGTWDSLLGHYRTYSPWYPSLRIVRRSGRLLLVAPGGVEAPSEEQELIEVAAGVFRIGADPWLPERLFAGPVVDGRVISVDRDGCKYSRAFSL